MADGGRAGSVLQRGRRENVRVWVRERGREREREHWRVKVTREERREKDIELGEEIGECKAAKRIERGYKEGER